MMAWQSFVFLFLLPATDLALRLVGLPGWIVVILDVGAAVALSVVLPRRLEPTRATLSRSESLRAFAACALVGVAWYALRVTGHQFGAYGENIYDLHYIASLARSSELPAPDLWNPGTRVDHYYYFGFYIVAFYTRMLGLAVGQAYALALLLIPVLVFANFWTLMRGPFALRLAAALTATFPATGLSAIVAGRLIEIPGHLQGMAHVRLTEWANLAPPDGSYGDIIRGYAYPVEGLAHILGSLGDLHPPVFTFALLALVLGALLGPARDGDSLPPLSRLVCGAAIPLAFVINPWTLPCFGVLGLYAMSRPLAARSAGWVALGAAALLSLLSPMLFHLDLPTQSVSLRWLPGIQRSTLAAWLVFWGPLSIATLILVASGMRGRIVLMLWFIAMIVGLEVLLLDDPYGDHFERFNGVLKIGSFGLAGWTAVLLYEAGRSPRRWIYPLLLAPLLALSLGQLWDSILPAMRKPLAERNWTLQPAAMLPKAEQRQLHDALLLRCPGTTLEHQTASAYSLSPLVSTLLGWPTLSGWTSHLSQIGAWSPAAQARFEATQQWFDNPQPAILQAAGVRYVLIDRSVNWDEQTLLRHRATLAPLYQFVRLSDVGDGIVGYFSWNARCAEDAPSPP